MSEFVEEGFLSTGINIWSQKCRKENSEWFTLCEEFNRFCLQLLKNPRINANCHQKALVLALFFRQLSIFEGIVILSERCMVNETKVLLRTLIENLFILRAISTDKTIAKQYIDYQYYERLHLACMVRKSVSKTPLYNGVDLTKRILELKDIVKQKGIKRISVEDWAKKAGLIDYYFSAYPILSLSSHSNVLDIGQYLHGNSDDDIMGVSWRPEIDGISGLLLAALECQKIGVESVNELFGLGAEAEIEEYVQTYGDLARKSKIAANSPIQE